MMGVIVFVQPHTCTDARRAIITCCGISYAKEMRILAEKFVHNT